MNKGQVLNERAAQVQSILGQVTNLGKAYVENATVAVKNVSTPETGNYIMKILFYFVFYAFIIFIVLTLVHFTITPIFRFTPGAKGYIGVPGTSDKEVYWPGKPPAPLDSAPDPDGLLKGFKFENNFTVSVDIFVTKLPDTAAQNRLILFKTFDFNGSGRSKRTLTNEQFQQLCGVSQTTTNPSNDGPGPGQNTQSYMAQSSSMIMYLTDTNDLVVTFFVGPNGTVYNSRPIQNIPLNSPFRITVVVEEKLFTVYLNGKQTFQRIVSEGIRLNSVGGLKTDSQRFYAPPQWAEQPKKTIYIQNLILWPRVIPYTEVTSASPALATMDSFGVSTDTPGSCM
jgi:hypothetical protein